LTVNGMLADVDSAVRLIEAIAKLFDAIAWPVAVATTAIYLLSKHRDAVGRVFDRTKSIGLPGGAQIDLFEKVQEQGQQVLDAASKVAETPSQDRQAVVDELVAQANRYQELSQEAQRRLTAELQFEPLTARQLAAIRRMRRQREEEQ
jgi:hypothetical protein